EDALAALHVGTRNDDAPVETARTEQSRIENVGPVGGRDEDDALVGLEAVHLDEELVQRLLALVVTAAEPCAAVAADGVDLVDEDDAGSVLLALLEEVAHAGSAHADEHLDDVGEGDLVVVLAEQARLALAEAHRLAAASLELAHQHEEDHDEDGEREPADHHLRPERLRIFLLEAQHHGLLPHLVEKLGVEGTD